MDLYAQPDCVNHAQLGYPLEQPEARGIVKNKHMYGFSVVAEDELRKVLISIVMDQLSIQLLCCAVSTDSGSSMQCSTISCSSGQGPSSWCWAAELPLNLNRWKRFYASDGHCCVLSKCFDGANPFHGVNAVHSIALMTSTLSCHCRSSCGCCRPGRPCAPPPSPAALPVRHAPYC
jgi:hypothetical protein